MKTKSMIGLVSSLFLTLSGFASLQMTLPAGSEENPSAVAPVELTGESVSFWWDATALHIGERTFAWDALGVKPEQGATFKIPLGESSFREPIVLEGKIDLKASKYRISGFGPIGNSEVKARTEVLSTKDGRLRSCLYGSGATQDYLNLVQNQATQAGKTTVFDIVGHGSSSGAGYYELIDADGVKLYDVSGYYKDPKLVFDLKYIWTDIEKKIVHVRTAGWVDDPSAYTMHVRALDYHTDTLGDWTKRVPVGKIWGEREYPVEVNDLPAGFYWLHFDFVDKAGRVVYTEKQPFVRPGAKMPWDNTTLGAEDTVPPPWSEPTFGEDGTFACWHRTVKLGGAGLVHSIVNNGQELLTAPVALVADGRELTFDVRLERAGKSQAAYVLTAREMPIEVRATCEFDGFVMFEASYPTTVQSLQWRVSVSRTHVTGFDDCSDERNPNILMPKGVRRELAFDPTQRHMWWMPGIRGLMGGILNFHGTHVRHLDKAGQVVAAEKDITVTTTFVDEAMNVKEARRTVTFYLEPTPVKPKDLRLASMDETERITWTGHVAEYFETKYPGFAEPVAVKRFTDEIDKGKRVFWYNGSSGVSPEDPFWNWFRVDWNMKGLDYFAHEAPSKVKRPSWRRGVWAYGCLNSKSYFDYKVWGVNWYLNDMTPKAKDLYFDLANPHACCNVHHGCQWTDDFGRRMRDWTMLSTRELHKRVYRLVKAKNKDGVLFGHISSKMCPSGVFFDMACAGEGYAFDVTQHDYTYFDVFTPECMQSFFVPRAQETVFNTSPQLLRARECWAPELYRTYDCNKPENVRAIRHCCAYIKIHDLTMDRLPGGREGWQFYEVDSRVRKLRDAGVYSAYYHESDHWVTLSNPGLRQLWAYFKNARGAILIVLNDTDQEVVQTVSVKGLSAKGVEILDKGAFDFTSGSCTVRLPPRDARFIQFDVKK